MLLLKVQVCGLLFSETARDEDQPGWMKCFSRASGRTLVSLPSGPK